MLMNCTAAFLLTCNVKKIFLAANQLNRSVATHQFALPKESAIFAWSACTHGLLSRDLDSTPLFIGSHVTAASSSVYCLRAVKHLSVQQMSYYL